MGKLAISIIFFIVALQISSYLFWAFDVAGGTITYPLGDVSSLSNIFSLNVYTILIGIGGAVGIGLAALLLKQGVYAIYAMLLWGIGVIFSVFQTFVLAIPNTIAALVPPQTNPFAYVNGVFDPSSTAINPLVVVFVFLFTFGAWWYLFGIVIQREPT